jgi:hypothetical protein
MQTADEATAESLIKTVAFIGIPNAAAVEEAAV